MTVPARPDEAVAPTLDDVDNQYVLAGRPLRSDYELADTACFRDDKWDLAPTIFQRQQKAVALDFSTLPAAYRLAVKHLCYALLRADILPPNESQLNPLSIRRHLVEIKRFVTWLDQRPGARPAPLRQLRRIDLTAYARHLDEAVKSPASREVAEVAVRLFWRYRSVLPEDHLTLDPLEADGWGRSVRRGNGENSTARIPEKVIGPLLTWCLRFVDDFAPDILTAWTRLLARPPASEAISRIPRGSTGSRLQSVLEGYLAAGRPLPGHPGGAVNYRQLSREVGCSGATLRMARHTAAVQAAARSVGVGPGSDLDTPIRGQLDGQPWLGRIGADQHDPYGAAILAFRLQTACYIVTAYLSGMRDSELKHLRRDCVRAQRDPAGVPYRWTVASLAFKGETDPAGTRATWVIGAPAARALAVLEQLQPASTDMLLSSLYRSGTSTRQNAVAVGRTNELINQLTGWINTYCADHDRDDVIPDIAGAPWKFSTRQFRRTLAWHIARRPGGAIAGAIQYRHLSIQMFEGYAGTSDSGFRVEVESEQALARGEQLLTMTNEHEHSSLSGPAAAEATRRLDQFSALARFNGAVISDPQRVRRLMRRHDPHVYPGDYITCVFDPGKALCQRRRDSKGTARPTPTSCQPLDCPNTALTVANQQSLLLELHHIDAELARRPALPPLLVSRLKTRREKLSTFLCRHDPTIQL